MVRAHCAQAEERGMGQGDRQAGWELRAMTGACGPRGWTACIPFIATHQLVQLSELLRFI